MLTKTACFLTPAVHINYSKTIYTGEYVGTYSGDVHYTSDDTWGEYLFFVYKETIDEELLNHFRSRPNYVTEYCPDKGLITFVFSFDEFTKERIVAPLLEGKYSKVDKGYVDRHFPNQHLHRLYGNRMVFDRHESMRKMWEERIDVELPKNAEVWSKPLKQEEIYGIMELSEVVERKLGGA